MNLETSQILDKTFTQLRFDYQTYFILYTKRGFLTLASLKSLENLD